MKKNSLKPYFMKMKYIKIIYDQKIRQTENVMIKYLKLKFKLESYEK